jgi:hypothetical protein
VGDPLGQSIQLFGAILSSRFIQFLAHPSRVQQAQDLGPICGSKVRIVQMQATQPIGTMKVFAIGWLVNKRLLGAYSYQLNNNNRDGHVKSVKKPRGRGLKIHDSSKECSHTHGDNGAKGLDASKSLNISTVVGSKTFRAYFLSEDMKDGKEVFGDIVNVGVAVG